jgi:transposase
MDEWVRIRRRVLVEGISKRQILRETGMHWTTLEKILSVSSPPGYQRVVPCRKPRIGPYLGRIEAILEQDKEMPKKQRHTAKRIWERLREEGFEGGYTIVKDAVRNLRRRRQEVFMPLIHRPGEAQVDFGVALVRMNGALRKVSFFAMVLPHSDAFFVMAFDRECTETFWEGHVQAFEHFQGVPCRIAYDNTKICISKIIGTRARRLTQGFLQLVSHYLFDPHFCLVRRANEKGVVEGLVKFARLNFFVPVPQVRDFAELNAHLLGRCKEDLQRRLRGKSLTKAQLLLEDQAAFRALPAAPFDACRIQAGQADSESLVRFDDNDYSVPVEYAHHPVVIKGYVETVEILYGPKVIATHPRSWERERQILDPMHYLSLIERKPGSLDHARPLEKWGLPEVFDVLRRRLEEEHREQDPGEGTREYIRVLRLLEKYTLGELTKALEQALKMRCHSRDAVAQFLVPAESWEATTFKLDGRPHLRHVKVCPNDPKVYSSLHNLAGVLP